MNAQIEYLMNEYGYDYLTAWRNVRDRERLRRDYNYQTRAYARKW